MNIPERLAYARERAGLTLGEVARRTGLGASSISEFQNGTREPSLGQLERLAKAYGRSVGFFLSDEPIAEEVVLWREKPAANCADTEAAFIQLCRQYHNLEMWTEQPVPECLPTASVGDCRSYAHVEALAKTVRDLFDLGDRPALSLLTVLEEVCGIKVFHLGFEPSGTAACTRSADYGAGILINARNVRWRRNFDLAHEFYHLLVWDVATRPTDGGDCAVEAEEKLANAFAAALLVPREAFQKAMALKSGRGRLTDADLFDLARQFDVSAETIFWRMKHARLLAYSEEQAATHAARLREQTQLYEQRVSEAPVEVRPKRYVALALRALRQGDMSLGRFAEYMGIGRRRATAYLTEETADEQDLPLADP